MKTMRKPGFLPRVRQRGLSIVEALVERWWVEDDRGRTTVHVRIPL